MYKRQAADHSVNATNTLTLPGGSVIGNSNATLVSDTGTQTLSGKTLTAPKIADGGFIADANGAEQVVHVFPIRPEEAHERQEGDREDDSRRNLRSGAGL